MAEHEGDEDAYILGTELAELERLGFQHEVWESALESLCRRVGVGAGAAVLDLGCGPGFTTLALARIVGPGGRVVGVDRSARFVAALRARAERDGLANVEAVEAATEALPAGLGPFDAAYARWLLFWLERPGDALRAAAAQLRSGGTILVQDYLRWGDLSLLPRCPAVDAAVAACLRHWRAAGVSVDVMEAISIHAADAGLSVEEIRPLARIAPAGAPEWRWIGTFLHQYLPRVVADGHLDEAGLVAFRAAWRDREHASAGHVVAPAMAEAVLRKPLLPAREDGAR